MPGPSFSTSWTSKKASSNAIKAFEDVYAKDMGDDLTRTARIDRSEVIPTGSLVLDDALGVGGYPVGSVVEIWGPEHVSKTTLGFLAVAQAQRTQPDKMAAWVDMEQSFDRQKGWAVALGVDLKRLWRPKHPPRTAEDVADATKRFVGSGLCSIVVLDSIGGMIGKVEYEKESDESTVAVVARIVTRMVKQVSPIGNANGTTTLVINQVRSNIAKYGPDTTTPGGWALRHTTTIRLKVSRGGSPPKTVQSNGQPVPVGYEVAVKVEKNRVAPYGASANFWLFNRPTDKHGLFVGVDKATEAFEFGKRLKIITGGAGGRYELPDGRTIIKGDNVIEELRVNPELVEQIRLAIVAKNEGKIAEESEQDDAADEMAKIAAEMGVETAQG